MKNELGAPLELAGYPLESSLGSSQRDSLEGPIENSLRYSLWYFLWDSLRVSLVAKTDEAINERQQ